jgi:hypothetical protein
MLQPKNGSKNRDMTGKGADSVDPKNEQLDQKHKKDKDREP